MTSIKDEIAEAITVGLHRNRMQQQDIADEMGIVSAAVSKWCKGDSLPTADKLVWLIRRLNLLPILFREDFEKLAQELPPKIVEREVSMTPEERLKLESLQEAYATMQQEVGSLREEMLNKFSDLEKCVRGK